MLVKENSGPESVEAFPSGILAELTSNAAEPDKAVATRPRDILGPHRRSLLAEVVFGRAKVETLAG